MGSFNMSCALSGVSISPGDKAVVILMEAAQRFQPSTEIILKPGTYFIPDPNWLSVVIPPIKGKYSDYGRLDWKAEDNPHLQYMNGNHNINYLLEMLEGLGTDDDKKYFPNGVFTVWIHGDVWDKMLAWWRKDPFKTATVWPTRPLLSALGFYCSGEKLPEPERYNDIWIHPEWKNVAIAADTQCFAKLVEKDGNGEWVSSSHYVCTFDDILKYAKKHRLPLDWDSAKHKATEFAFREELREAIETLEYEKESYDVWTNRDPAEDDIKGKQYKQELLARGPYVYRDHNWGFMAGSRYKGPSFTRLWAQALINYQQEVIDRMVDFQDISHIFYDAGQMLLPACLGPQCGEPRVTRYLGKVMQEISKTE